MSSNYTRGEVPTKGLKQTEGVCMQLLTVSALPAQVAHCPPVGLLCLFFRLIPLSTPSFACLDVRVHTTVGAWLLMHMAAGVSVSL